MTVKNVVKDPQNLSMTLTAQFPAPIDKVWRVWDDPRRLERWWGPPTYPSTFVDHDLTPGGHVAYYMTSPEGDKYHGWWTVVAVDALKRIEFIDGFADDSGNPNPDMPTTTTVVTLSESDGVTTMTIDTRFPSIEAMDQMVAMGMEEGLTLAVGQIDELLLADVTS